MIIAMVPVAGNPIRIAYIPITCPGLKQKVSQNPERELSSNIRSAPPPNNPSEVNPKVRAASSFLRDFI